MLFPATSSKQKKENTLKVFSIGIINFEAVNDADFFDAANLSSINFNSISYKNTGEKTFKLTGNFTRKGVTNEITLDTKLNGIIIDKRCEKIIDF
ncbi:polyisoprenoid-binding protein YceI [Saonia flava]|uniref:Polyisoprenoid-binding protein YceI n=1 Tax=Saonia flava TaxID=523696 RepID=A0A846QYK8_9FLAO|nr:YceI family protein [Saonia flava]NJB70214.1 polyisoprenoid-binding protein YceI [Saonia flava]